MPIALAKQSELLKQVDLVNPYVDDLVNVVDMAAIQRPSSKLGSILWAEVALITGVKLATLTNSI